MARLQTLRSPLQILRNGPAQSLGRIDATPRLRGRPGMRRREQWLQLHPLCAHCEQDNPPRVTAGEIVDHTRPLWAGGADDYETNGATLCRQHHDAKTACEAAMRAAGGWMAAPCTCGKHRG